MLRFRRLLLNPNLLNHTTPRIITTNHEASVDRSFQRTTYRHIKFYQIFSKEAVEKERARIKDEMNRGYFADIAEMEQHGGKVGMTSQTISPAISSVKFPSFEVNDPNGSTIKLPITYPVNGDKPGKIADAGPSLLCLSFRANAQGMINTWTRPFLDTFSASKYIQIYEVSIVESGFLSFAPVKKLLLWILQKPQVEGEDNTLRKQNVYAFGDHYYFRKELKILNLLTGYIFLLDSHGRIRWQGTGIASEEEVALLLSCTSSLLEEK